MAKSYQRYEVLLPRRFNDGSPIPDALVAKTLREFRDRFGAVSIESHTIQGQWKYRGKVFHDELVRIFVDVEESPQTRRTFEQIKVRLKGRFKQIDIWMTTYPVEVI